MRILLVTVLAAVLWSGKALSLKCYSCATHSNSSHCMIPTVCSELDKYCKTTVAPSETGKSSHAFGKAATLPGSWFASNISV
uniref:Snake toxin/toxin-like domain-containing protein n=1 Tax=Podarcis muralis TaxID=64176 RepID=A0A670I9D7_PODMU